MNPRDPDGTTPLDPDEAEALIPSGVATRADLNAWEQEGIRRARLALLRSRRAPSRVLKAEFLRRVHREMFGGTWAWAGRYRRSDKNIGAHWTEIPTRVREALDDTTTWVASSTWSVEEIAARFHHRLVTIHPFPNGNGRWSRLATDILMRSLDHQLPTWGIHRRDPRADYLSALRSADGGRFGPLVEFMWDQSAAAHHPR